ncbi:MAG: alpha/beta hydrolase [Microcystis wesenbergii Mw_QC_B_20070930_S4]|jgi:esterase FrsA|nr:MAG: alpha/beta hydrolase [Microcystis wesenbergii Mw_QC_B_20070930_S4D]TRV15810.1 MAG: alpha/beta hydrolase [Microcystis wesenbergii Mw_QC_B_20070930_S4]
MNYLDELKELVLLHGQAQGLTFPYCQSILERITCEEGNGPGSWVYEWTKDAPLLEHKARWLEAVRLYNLARFPFVQSEERQQAHQACVAAFNQWLSTKTQIQTLEILQTEGHFKVYFKSNNKLAKQPLLVVLGGIVSLKEQWVAFLEKTDALGMAIALTEMPGVGENTLPYGINAWKMFSALLNRLSPLADITNTYVVALSFSGHLAIQHALQEQSVKGITTVGAPIHHFFTDQKWWNQVPLTTKRTLAHILQIQVEDLLATLTPMALSDVQLNSLSIPLNYVFSRRDEIIPLAEKYFLQQHTPRLCLQEFDDTHGSPHHLKEMQLWIPLSILCQRADSSWKTKILHLRLLLQQTKRLFKLGT